MNAIRTLVKLELSSYLQSFSYGRRPGCSLEVTLEELTQKPVQATLASLPKGYPNDMRETIHTAEKNILNQKTINLPLNPRKGRDLRYNGDERSDTDEDRRKNSLHQKKKGDKKIRDRNSKAKRNLSDSDRSGFHDGRDDDPVREKNQSHRRKTKKRRRVHRRDRNTDLNDFSAVSSLALLQLSGYSGNHKDFDLDDGERRRKNPGRTPNNTFVERLVCSRGRLLRLKTTQQQK